MTYGHEKGGLRDFYSFTYTDAVKGGSITEQVHIDRLSGRCVWTRGRETGRSWLLSQVTGVQYFTKIGDPSREVSRGFVQNYAFSRWLRRTMPSILVLLTLSINALSLAMLLAGMLFLCLWHALPRDDEGRLDMYSGLESNALALAVPVAFLTGFAALVAGWWLGVFRCTCCRTSGPSADRKAIAQRLDARVSNRWPFQLPFGFAACAATLITCAYTVVLNPVAHGFSGKMECSGKCDAGWMEPMCGVGSCSCGVVDDLMCTPFAPMGQENCVHMPMPLCVAEGMSDEASGVHGPFLVAVICSLMCAGALFLLWLVTAASFFCSYILDKSSKEPLEPTPVHFHRFMLSLQSKHETKVIFNVSAEEDPQAVADTVLPPAGTTTPRAPATINSLMYSPSSMASVGAPGGFDTGGTTSFGGGSGAPTIYDVEIEPQEPQWC